MLLLIMADSASAYIDPGSGSYVFQLLIAGFLGALFAAKGLWRNAKGYFVEHLRKKNSRQDDCRQHN
jgi:hypothetical protein